MKSLWKQWEERSMTFSKNDLKGTGQVFSFTFLSLLKNKANIIAMVIFAVIGLLAVPAVLLFGGSGVSVQTGSALSGVAVYNETELPMEEGEIAADDNYFSGVVFRMKDREEGVSIEEGLSPEETAALITRAESGEYQIRIYASPDTELTASDMEPLEGLFQREITRAGYKAAGLSDSQIRLLTADYTTDVQTVSDYADETGEDAGSGYVIQLVYAIVVLMVSIMSVSYIIRAVVEEKSSKLVEMLLLNVRPLALIAGKILAALSYVFSILILFVVCLLVSYGVSSRIFGIPGLGEMFGIASEQFGMANIGFGMIVFMIVSLLLGCLTFAIIAGISGAGCSSMDDLSGAASASTLLIMAGYFVSIVVVNVPSRGAELFSSLCPVLSVFCSPVQYAMGTISLGMLIVSWLVQAAVLLLLAVFCAKIYSYLIMYKGNRLTWKKMIGIARQKTEKGGVK